MNIVLLCKSWNHHKALQILTALHDEQLTVRGIVALTEAPKKMTFADIVRKAHVMGNGNFLRGALRRLYPNGMAKSLPGVYARHVPAFTNGFDPALHHMSANGKPFSQKHGNHATTIAEHAKQHHIEMIVVDDLNGAESVAALQRMQTEILLLGGVPIIRANVLSVPKICTLNVHMGLLPEFRGVNVAEWSVFCGAPVGVTVHQVDPGVDTGAILYREEIDVSGCRSIETMRAKVSAAQHRVLAKCTRLLAEKQLVPQPQKKEDGKQYYAMHEKLRKIVDKKLSQGYTWLNSCYVLGLINKMAQAGEELGACAFGLY
jgi:folate-dependent phosphoribosylglycinamide formyltransferase PurN